MLSAMDWDEIRRWAASAAVVLCAHALAITLLVRSEEPVAADSTVDVVTVDLAPFAAPPSDSKQDIAPGPEQQEQIEAPRETQPTEQEQVQQEKIEPTPPVPSPDVTLPEEPKPDAPKQEITPPVQEATAPPPPRPSSAQVTSWHRKIAEEIERHKRYPSAARARREFGKTQLGFTMDRQGIILASRIVRSSGYPSLDQEAIATVLRAQPLPPPPNNLPGTTFDFIVPIQFKINSPAAVGKGE
jgi:protein TonB